MELLESSGVRPRQALYLAATTRHRRHSILEPFPRSLPRQTESDFHTSEENKKGLGSRPDPTLQMMI